MKNIKSNVSYLFLISFTLLTHRGYIKAGDGSGAGFAVHATEIFVGALPNAETVKGVTDDVGINSTNRFSDSLDKATASSDAWRTTLANGGARLADGATMAFIGVVVGGAVYYGVREGKKIAKWWNPEKYEDKEKLLRIKKVVREAQIIDLEGKFAESLAKHAFEEKNEMGIPLACVEDANKYAAVAGIKALATVVGNFKEACATFYSEKQIA